MLLEQLPTLMALVAVLRINCVCTNPPEKATESRLLPKGEAVGSVRSHNYYIQKRNPVDTKSHLPSGFANQFCSAQLGNSSQSLCSSTRVTRINVSIIQTFTFVGKKQQAACNGFVREVKTIDGFNIRSVS